MYQKRVTLTLMLLQAITLAFANAPGIRAMADDPQYVSLNIFLNVDKIRGQENDGGYELYADGDTREVCEEYAKDKLGRFHQGKGVSDFYYSDTFAQGDSEGVLPKIINYRVLASRQNAALKFLWADPAVTKITFAEIFELSAGPSSINSKYPCVLRAEIVKNEKAAVKAARSISDVQWIGRDPDENAVAYLICKSESGEEKLRAVQGLARIRSMTKADLQERNIWDDSFNSVFVEPNEPKSSDAGATDRHEIKVGSKREATAVLENVLKMRPATVRIAELSEDSVKLIGDDRQIRAIEQAIR